MANSEPHVHQPTIQRSGPYNAFAPEDYELVYGDTKVKICKGWFVPNNRAIRHALVKAIHEHDRGSNPVATEQILRQFSSAITPGKWGTEVLKELTK